MQNKKTKKQLQKEIRRMHERMGALAIALGIVGGSVAISHDARRVLTGLAMHPAFAVVEHSTKESDVAHRAARLDDGFRVPHISGS